MPSLNLKPRDAWSDRFRAPTIEELKLSLGKQAAHLLESTRGKLGGFRLARPAHRIALVDVVGLFDDVTGRRTCLMGRTTCSDHNACAAHARWKGVSEQVAEFFRDTSVADLVADRGKGGKA